MLAAQVASRVLTFLAMALALAAVASPYWGQFSASGILLYQAPFSLYNLKTSEEAVGCTCLALVINNEEG